MKGRQERVKPLDRAYDLSSLSSEVEAVARGDRSMQQCPRGEWRRFLLTERRRTPRERPELLTWVLDNASDQDTAAVLSELPRPAHLVYRHLLRPRYQAQRRWQPA
jgi:hypothetical protein